ncbi:MAG: ABC transporter ATP-binding protein [Myxococcales bacterium]
MVKGRGLFALLRDHLGALALGGLTLLATNALEKAIPWFLKRGVDAFSAEALDRVTWSAAWVVLCALAMMVTRTISRIAIFNVGRDIEFDLRTALLDQLHRLGAAFLTRMPTGDVMSRATNDLAQVRLLLGFGSLNLVNAVVAYLSALALMVAISPKLTLYALIPYPLFVLAARAFVRKLFHVSQENQVVLGKLAERVQEYLSGVRVVRAYAADGFEAKRFDATNQEAVQRTMSLVMLRASMTPVLMGLSTAGTLIVLYAGGVMVNAGELTKGELLAFYAYLTQLVWPTMAAGYILSIVQRGRASYARVREILDAEPVIPEPRDARAIPRRENGRFGEGHVTVSHLNYAIEGRSLLRDVSFEVPAGSSLAIMGRTGSGKSVLAALLARLSPTPAGSVFLDGADVTSLRLGELRKAVGYAPQDPFLFSTTVARNIGFSLPDPDSDAGMAAVRGAAQEAAILQEIEQLKDGLDTVVGERGVQLSGGQKQRIALARAMLNNPSVLILDDPLSAVDARTERIILDALDQAAVGRTMLLITNRTAAAAHCDRILVLDHGSVAEFGSHAELLKRGGLYARLCARQTLEQELSTL